jgi:cytoskeletal protein CcmA (bactofilin family)
MASMFEKQKIEGIKAEGAETIVGTSVKLKGNLKSDGDIIIDGIVTGELKTKGSVIIGKNANIIANIKAKDVVISGAVQGNIEATDRLDITETGKVVGDIAANVLSIAAGALFTGSSKMNDNHREVVAEPVMEEEAEIPEEK